MLFSSSSRLEGFFPRVLTSPPGLLKLVPVLVFRLLLCSYVLHLPCPLGIPVTTTLVLLARPPLRSGCNDPGFGPYHVAAAAAAWLLWGAAPSRPPGPLTTPGPSRPLLLWLTIDSGASQAAVDARADFDPQYGELCSTTPETNDKHPGQSQQLT